MTKKERILETAEQLFSENGFEKTTMDDIAKRLNIRKGGIYYHYKNKEDIMKSVVKKQIILFKTHVTNMVEAEQNPQDKIKAYIDGRLIFLEENEQNYNYLKRDFIKTYQFLKSHREDMEKWEIDFISKIFMEQNDDKVSSEECALFAQVIDTFCKGLEVSWFVDAKDSDLHKRCETFTNFIIDKCEKDLRLKYKDGEKND